MSQKKKFSEFQIDPRILAAVEAKGFEYPTEIQEKSYAVAIGGTGNIVGKAQTGTGKTAAFGVPILTEVSEEPGVQTLILCPTRELAQQVTQELQSLRGEKRVMVTSIYGGQPYREQLHRLKKGDQIIVGTPGRIVDHLKRGTLILDNLNFLVLDEADEMLNMGFAEELEKVLSHVPEDARKFLFSATMNKKMLSLVKKYIHEYDYIEVEAAAVTSLSEQKYLEVQEVQKFTALTMIIDQDPEFYGIIFCRTKRDVDQLKDRLLKNGYRAACIHGDIPQKKREHVLRRFKDRETTVLVATDVAARGIDIGDLNHVINYHLPEDTESYVHRVGRTGRAGKKGVAISLVGCSEYGRMQEIQKETNIDLEQIAPFTAERMQEMQLAKLIRNIEATDHPNDVYMALLYKLLDEFEPSELMGKLLHKAFRGITVEELAPIDRRKSRGKRKGGGRRRSGGYRGGRSGGRSRSGSGRRRSGGGSGSGSGSYGKRSKGRSSNKSNSGKRHY